MQDIQLDDKKKAQLDGNIKKMLEGGATEDDIMQYASDFKNQFGQKKNLVSSQSLATPSRLPKISEQVSPLQQGANIVGGGVIGDISKTVSKEGTKKENQYFKQRFLGVRPSAEGDIVERVYDDPMGVGVLKVEPPKREVKPQEKPVAKAETKDKSIRGVKPIAPTEYEYDPQGWLLNMVSAIDKGVYKTLGSSVQGVGTALQGVTSKITGGTGEGFISDALIKLGSSYNQMIDELTPQDESFKGSLSDQVGQALGFVGGLALTGGASSVARGSTALIQQVPKSGALSSAVKELVKGTVSPTGVVGGLTMGQAEFDRAKQSGATDEQAFEAFYKNAAVGSVLERIPVMHFLKRFNNATAGGVVNYIKTKGVAGLTGGLEEMTTEMLQQLYANKTAKDIYNENQDLFEGVAGNGTVGFSVGFLLNAMGANAKILRKQGKVNEAKLVENQVKELEEKAKGQAPTNSSIATKIAVNGNEEGLQRTQAELDNDLQKGLISEEEYQDKAAVAQKVAEFNAKIPDFVQGVNRAESIQLIEERENLQQELLQKEEQKKGIDVAYHKFIDESNKETQKRIDEINNRLGELSKPEKNIIKPDVKTESLEYGGSKYYITDNDGNQIGSAEVSTVDDKIIIDNLFVDEKNKRKGLATSILDKIIEDFKGRNYEYIDQNDVEFSIPYKIEVGTVVSEEGQAFSNSVRKKIEEFNKSQEKGVLPKEEIQQPIEDKKDVLNIENKKKDILDEVTDEKIGEKDYQDFSIDFSDGARAFGTIEDGVALISGINAPKNESGIVRGSKTYERLLDKLKEQGIGTVQIKLQSKDSSIAIDKLIEKGILINPRNMTGVSTNQRPTKFDIAGEIKKPAQPEIVESVRAEQEPELPEGTKVVTLSGMEEGERVKAVEERKKKTTLTEKETLHNDLIDLANRVQKSRGNEKTNLQGQIRQKVRELNAKAGEEIYKYDGVSVRAKVKSKTKGERYLKIKGTTRDTSGRAIKEDAVLLFDRSPEFVQKYEELADSPNITALQVDSGNGVSMTADQIESALQDIADGIPSVQADNLLNALEEGFNRGYFDLRGKDIGQDRVQASVEDFIGVQQEEVGQPMDEDAMVDWLNEIAELPQEEQIEIDNIILEYEQQPQQTDISGKVQSPNAPSKTTSTPSPKPSEEGKGIGSPQKEVNKQPIGEAKKQDVKDDVDKFLKEVGIVVVDDSESGLLNLLASFQQRNKKEVDYAELTRKENGKYVYYNINKVGEDKAIEFLEKNGIKVKNKPKKESVEDWSKDVESTEKALEGDSTILPNYKKLSRAETFREKLNATTIFEGGEIDLRHPNNRVAWRSMGANEFARLLNGEEKGGGVAKKGDWFSNYPKRAAQQVGEGKYLVEFSGVDVEGETIKQKVNKDFVTGIWKYKNGKWNKITPNRAISEAYHKSKEDDSNPELVKAVEDLLGKPKEQKAEAKPKEDVKKVEPKTPLEQQYEEASQKKGEKAQQKAKEKLISDNFDGIVAQLMTKNKIKRQC